MKNVILQKHDGIVETINVSPDNIENLRVSNLKESHKCAQNCANAYTTMCPKIADIRKKSIDKYDFITDGKQLYDNNGEMVFFIVSECTKYIEALKKDLPAGYKSELIKSILTNYFDETDPIEALKKWKSLIKRGEYRDVLGVTTRARSRYYED